MTLQDFIKTNTPKPILLSVEVKRQILDECFDYNIAKELWRICDAEIEERKYDFLHSDIFIKYEYTHNYSNGISYDTNISFMSKTYPVLYLLDEDKANGVLSQHYQMKVFVECNNKIVTPPDIKTNPLYTLYTDNDTIQVVNTQRFETEMSEIVRGYIMEELLPYLTNEDTEKLISMLNQKSHDKN
jgi:hypothetical protein